jgi:LysM repeat protein
VASQKETKMNKSPVTPPSTSDVINSYRKRRQQRGPSIIYILAGVLILGGVILLIVWLSGPSKPLNAMFATDTPTPTITPSPTNTSTPTATPTETPTATVTATGTPSAPFNYTVQEGDYLSTISDKFALGDDGVALILMLNPYSADAADHSIDPVTQIVYPSQAIWIPNPGMPLPTATPIPSGLPKGTKVSYTVRAGDSLGSIAILFSSTVDDIMKENKLEDANAIKIGQILIIPVNLVTPTATRPPTSTPLTAYPTATVTPIFTATP